LTVQRSFSVGEMAGLMVRVIRSVRPSPTRFFHQQAPDYYTILGVKKHAELKDIKFAYFNMAKKFHPDNNQTLDARQVFALIAEAYDVLSDPSRREKYDDTGLAEHKFGGTSTGPERQSSDSTQTAEQMYQRIFGQEDKGENEEYAHTDFAESYAGSEATREYIISISAEDALLGTDRTLNLRLPGTCNKCDGSRSQLGYTGNICPYCEGTGQETIKTGHITARKTCCYCNGEKIFLRFKCDECEGLGRIIYDHPHEIKIPAGVLHGEVIRIEFDPTDLNVFGDHFKGESFRAIYVTISVRKSEQFSVDGHDIVVDLKLSPALALLGGKCGVYRPAGDILVNVGACTSSHSNIVVADRGVRLGDNLAGDLVIKTSIKVPEKLGWRQRRIFMKFAATVEEASGIIEGIPSELEHKLNVNVLDADTMNNSVVKKEKPKRMDKSITDFAREKLGVTVNHPLGKQTNPYSHPTKWQT